MGDGENSQARLAGWGIHHRLNIKRLALKPSLEARCGKQIIQLHRKGKPIFRREKRVDIHHADLRHRRRLNGVDQGREIKILSLPPGLVEDRGQEDVFTTLDGISLNAKQAKQTRHGGADPLAQQFRIVKHVGRGCGEGF